MAPEVSAKGVRYKNLDMTALRKKAMKIVPYRTQWIGRVDVIPPQSDDRTALIDRALILLGRFTEAEIAEFHRVGDLWLEYDYERSLLYRARNAAQKAVYASGFTVPRILEQLQKKKREARAAKRAEARRAREARAAGIAWRKANDIIYLGRGVSSRLNERHSDLEALRSAGLPLLATPADVAHALQITVPQLRWLAFHAEAARRPHYTCFTIPKRSGGDRQLAAPMPHLARAQRWILDHVLAPLPTHDAAHGFIATRSTATNAAPHVGQDVVVNLDLKDFFPTITFRRVRGWFQHLGYSPAVATILALLCTEPPRQEVTYDGQVYQVAVGEPALPQGACTSPALSNQIARRLDARLQGWATSRGWIYTRYADDLTFSAPAGHRDQLGALFGAVRTIVTDEGFTLHPDKGRVQRASRRQQVTGIVVNDKPGLPRREVRRLRAILHQARATGLEAQNRDNHPDFEAHIRGKLAYLAMVDRARGMAMLKELDAIVGR